MSLLLSYIIANNVISKQTEVALWKKILEFRNTRVMHCLFSHLHTIIFSALFSYTHSANKVTGSAKGMLDETEDRRSSPHSVRGRWALTVEVSSHERELCALLQKNYVHEQAYHICVSTEFPGIRGQGFKMIKNYIFFLKKQ